MSALEVAVGGTVGKLSFDVAFRTGDRPLVIVGPNGAGKTTLLLMILGASTPQRGRIVLDNEILFEGTGGINVPVERRRIGFTPQRYALFPHLNVLRNVAYGVSAPSRAQRLESAMAALIAMGAGALASRRTTDLSGGEAQKVALARSLAHKPRALILDEPLGALDVASRSDVRRFLATHLRAWRLPNIVVTHDLADAEAFDGDLLVMERGAIVQRGRLSDLAAHPETEFVKRFVSGYLG